MQLRTLHSIALGSLTALAVAACQALPQPSATQRVSAQTSTGGNRMASRYPNLPAQADTVPGEWVVRLKPTLRASGLQSLSSLGLQKVRSVGPDVMGIHVLKQSNGRNVSLEALRQRPEVLWAEPLYLERVELTPAGTPARAETGPDPLYSQQYAHELIQSPAGWQIFPGKPSDFLAVIDSGIDLKHPDLAAKLIPGYDVLDQDDQPWDGLGHGTHCAGIAAALTHNGIGIAGTAPQLKIMPVRVLGDNGIGDSADVATGIIWAVDHGAKVISMSLGGLMNPLVKREAVQYALDRDVLIVAAMGNNGKEMKSYPAAQPGVLAVGASDDKDQRAAFSQFGDWLSVTAPGVKILSTLPTYANPYKQTDYGLLSGTSMATPTVAGLAALIRSHSPQLKRDAVKALIEKGAADQGDPGFDTFYGHGRLNLPATLSQLR